MGQAFSWIRGDDDESPHPLVGPDSGAALPPHAAAANNASSSADGRAGSNAGGGVAYGRSSVPRPMTNRPGTNRPDIMGSTPMGMTAARVAVIGGGVSGASLVFALRESIRRNQIQVTVFDEGTFTGGRAGTHRHSRQKPAGLRVDHGAPDFFASTTVFTRLCHDLYEQGVLKLVEDDSYWAVLRPDGYFWPDESSPWLSSTAPSYQVDHHFSHMSHPTFPISHILILFESPAPIFNGTHSQNPRPHAPPTPPCPINAHTPSTPIPHQRPYPAHFTHTSPIPPSTPHTHRARPLHTLRASLAWRRSARRCCGAARSRTRASRACSCRRAWRRRCSSPTPACTPVEGGHSSIRGGSNWESLIGSSSRRQSPHIRSMRPCTGRPRR